MCEHCPKILPQAQLVTNGSSTGMYQETGGESSLNYFIFSYLWQPELPPRRRTCLHLCRQQQLICMIICKCSWKLVTPSVSNNLQWAELQSPLHIGNKGSVVWDMRALVEAGLSMGQVSVKVVLVYFLLSIHSTRVRLHRAKVCIVSNELQTGFDVKTWLSNTLCPLGEV